PRVLPRERKLAGKLHQFVVRTGAWRERENIAESTECGVGEQLGAGRTLAEFARKRGHRDVGDPAGHYQVEVRQVGGHVEGEAVPGDPVFGVHSDGRQLPSTGPDAGEPFTPFTLESVERTGADERLLDLSQVPVQVLPVPLEVHYRIAHELA